MWMNKTLDSEEEEREERSRYANRVNDSTTPKDFEA